MTSEPTPATDKRIAYIRVVAGENRRTANDFSNGAVLSLIARIDADAKRIEDLEKTLWGVASALDEYAERNRDCAAKVRAALKEPT